MLENGVKTFCVESTVDLGMKQIFEELSQKPSLETEACGTDMENIISSIIAEETSDIFEDGIEDDRDAGEFNLEPRTEVLSEANGEVNDLSVFPEESSTSDVEQDSNLIEELQTLQSPSEREFNNDEQSLDDEISLQLSNESAQCESQPDEQETEFLDDIVSGLEQDSKVSFRDKLRLLMKGRKRRPHNIILQRALLIRRRTAC
eukprot:TRINITY_DN4418_c0_g1_i1.p1 TRINITY_DN4418_c0_g1~~TRINITY_DN4418_c0_g1_i1.p1  ORF type:complete len:204 (-),score=27.56 TRINITY_DN4418_c0_g1_i1:111-722(-)